MSIEPVASQFVSFLVGNRHRPLGRVFHQLDYNPTKSFKPEKCVRIPIWSAFGVDTLNITMTLGFDSASSITRFSVIIYM